MSLVCVCASAPCAAGSVTVLRCSRLCDCKGQPIRVLCVVEQHLREGELVLCTCSHCTAATAQAARLVNECPMRRSKRTDVLYRCL